MIIKECNIDKLDKCISSEIYNYALSTEFAAAVGKKKKNQALKAETF